MANPRSLLRRFSSLNTDELAATAITETEYDFVQANQAQLFAGLTKTGDDIKPLYAASTVKRKKRFGQPTDRVTLKDTGAFYEGLQLDVSGDVIKESSSDFKNEFLVKRYGNTIFGLGGAYKADYLRENLRPLFMQKITQATGLKV